VPTQTPALTEETESQTDEEPGLTTPTPEEIDLTITPTAEQEVDSEITTTPTPSENETLEVTPTPSVLVEEESVDVQKEEGSLADASSEQAVSISNTNEAEITNTATVSAETGANTSGENACEIETGNAAAEADVSNVVNTNLVGSDFWQVIINLFSTSNNDLDLTQIEGYQSFDPQLISVLATNQNTQDGLVNIALADLLSAYTVYNKNTASLTNNLDVSANTGDNLISGEQGTVQTGEATSNLNLSNLVNTNLVGEDWFFALINLFKDLNGDIVLPYELEYLDAEGENFAAITALNQNTGDNSINVATASLSSTFSVENVNNAVVTNNVEAEANTGNNTIVGANSSIETGTAQAIVNLANLINTNITGSRWLLLAINNYGGWQGEILGWWGNTITIGNTTYAWIRLPQLPENVSAEVTAINQDTADSSQNLALAEMQQSMSVSNQNQAVVENNLKVSSDTGNNQICGSQSSINTGKAETSVNVSNVVNTNIVGNNWYFGVINIFSNFFGNIIFPRPDLNVIKASQKSVVSPGEQITYNLWCKNLGRVWAKNVVVEDVLPSGLKFVSASDNGLFNDGKIVWNLGQLASGEEKVLTITVLVDSENLNGAVLTNSAAISSTTQEPNTGNNYSQVAVVVNFPLSTDTGKDTTVLSDQNSSSCTTPEAPKAPTLLSIEQVSPTEVKLTWSKVERANNYLVSYGPAPKQYLYGNTNLGEVDSYVVGSLIPNVSYYFAVAASITGDCPVAGPYSNELARLSSVSLASQVLGTSATGAPADLTKDKNTSLDVAGVTDQKTCPYWWVVLLGQSLALGGFYGLLLTKVKNPRGWFLVAPIMVGLALLADQYAHTHWYEKSTTHQ